MGKGRSPISHELSAVSGRTAFIRMSEKGEYGLVTLTDVLRISHQCTFVSTSHIVCGNLTKLASNFFYSTFIWLQTVNAYINEEYCQQGMFG